MNCQLMTLATDRKLLKEIENKRYGWQEQSKQKREAL
jgi:hypothetical protein